MARGNRKEDARAAELRKRKRLNDGERTVAKKSKKLTLISTKRNTKRTSIDEIKDDTLEIGAAPDRHQQQEDDEETGPDDPFQHFEVVIDENLTKLCRQQLWKTRTEKWDHLGTVHVHEIDLPDSEKHPFAIQIDPTLLCTSFIKPKLLTNLAKANKISLREANDQNDFTPFQKEMLLLMRNYIDILYTDRTFASGEELRLVYGLHVLNHALKTRSRITHHNSKLLGRDVDEGFRDQGLTRPKALILVPFKEGALRIVKVLTDLLSSTGDINVINKKRFQNEFGGAAKPVVKARKRPDDYEAIFSGNTDDMFRIGIAITKKSLKLYADFYSCDLIIASPLGLRTLIGAEGDKERDFDFLSSIEILILDQADVFIMQNWEHILHIFHHLHLQPLESHGVDFSRVRMWCLNGWSKFYRQTLIFSSISHPCFNALFNKNCFNYSGKIKILNPVSKGTISHITFQLSQIFHRFSAATATEIPEMRFKTFCSKILNDYKDSSMSHTLIFIPSYFDFVRVRNYFKREGVSFVQVCEYTKERKIARARDYFYHGQRHFLLYTERAHFYNRFNIKGIRHIIFYELPTYPHFYSELCNMIQQSTFASSDIGNMSCMVLYTLQNAHQLSAVVGTQRATIMLSSSKNLHMFVTTDT